MNELKQMINEYSELIRDNEHLNNEIELLNKKSVEDCLEDNELWISYSDSEKQAKRILTLRIIRKTEGYDKGVFELEERVTDLYETIENALLRLNENHSEILILRLRVFLLLVKHKINCCRDLRKVKDFYLQELQVIITDCINSDKEKFFIEVINILYLEFKLFKTQQALNFKQ
jgi:hypothetical protein